MSKIIYGTITKSIEDYSQCVVLEIPDDIDDLEGYIEEYFYHLYPQTIVCLEEVKDALLAALSRAHVPNSTAGEIMDDIQRTLEGQS